MDKLMEMALQVKIAAKDDNKSASLQIYS